MGFGLSDATGKFESEVAMPCQKCKRPLFNHEKPWQLCLPCRVGLPVKPMQVKD